MRITQDLAELVLRTHFGDLDKLVTESSFDLVRYVAKLTDGRLVCGKMWIIGTDAHTVQVVYWIDSSDNGEFTQKITQKMLDKIQNTCDNHSQEVIR